MPANDSAPRLAELIGSLSLATDVAAGLPPEAALRTSLLAVELARDFGVPDAELRDVFYAGLLRFVGCTSNAHETAWGIGGGDDLGTLRALTLLDPTNPADLPKALRAVGRGTGVLGRVRAAALLLDPRGMRSHATAHCDLAMNLARKLEMSDAVITTLGQIYERFDGKGNPHGLRGDAIALHARIVHVACRVEMHRGLAGADAAREIVRERRGTEVDPKVADAFLARAPEHLGRLNAPSVWEDFLESEPLPQRRLRGGQLPQLAEAFARFVDLKSPYTLNHSTGVAALVEAAAAGTGLPADEVQLLRTAALLHDIGRVSVPNGIWDKPGPLGVVEQERARQHAYQTERILGRSPLFADVAAIAGLHHERMDGSGYYRGLSAGALGPGARLLAAADAYHAMTESRAYRSALSSAEAADRLASEARAGRHDRTAVEAVLAAAGHRRDSRIRGGWPQGLSDREVEVLRRLARGESNKEIGRALFISARTVQQHVRHIYEKTAVSTRAAAALFAVENRLLEK
jgi:putative nucleotidyltransferase with HDIG domain